jgi:FMN phosphatase YigB (HAD superfamily)
VHNHTGPEPIRGVIFDFHATLVDGGDPARWIADAQRHLAPAGASPSRTGGEPTGGEPTGGEVTGGEVTGGELTGGEVTGGELTGAELAVLREYLHDIWRHANEIDPRSERDLSQELHRDVFTRTVSRLPGIGPDLIDALYTVMTDQWTAFADTLPVLQELKSRGLRIVVLSNTGLDIRPCLKRAGVSDLLDGVVLSYEVGMVKPDPAIFELALELLEVPAAQTLMVGDSPRDDVGGAPLRIRTLILPRTEGPVHGLGTVLRMV